MKSDSQQAYQHERDAARAAMYRQHDAQFAEWAAGHGVISHHPRTQVRVYDMVDQLLQRKIIASKSAAYMALRAADVVSNAAMWIVVHMTYAKRVYWDGRDLDANDFKVKPEGHTGGALNMVPAYTGYMAVDALTHTTRAWMMGQGHCVAAVDAVNLLLGNMTPEHAERYALDDAGLTRFVGDFYAYKVKPDGRPASPLGSHVNPLTGGGLLEGGYLGFADVQYVHAPLPGERLVVFLSDGAFEEQRGSDWAPRWWRAEDTGLVTPIMICNGRRIDQRTTMSQSGGVHWFREHLRLNHFDPIDVDGTDPADIAWAIFETEERLSAQARAIAAGEAQYPVWLPYAIAEAPKGFGFPGAGTNRAHNLPLPGNPHLDAESRAEFNQGARRLWVPATDLRGALAELQAGGGGQRGREADTSLAHRKVDTPTLPALPEPMSDVPMEAIDADFSAILTANPGLRPRVGNPDELRSNHMNKTLDQLKHRVTAPEPGNSESVCGGVITALNEEAVVSAVLANKAGINAVVSYEAFAVKMLGALRQDIIFARHQAETGRPAGWLGVPIMLSSHVWENGKNEQSHQDPTLAEALWGEMSDVCRVVFPADSHSAIAALRACYQTHGQIWALVVPKLAVKPTLSWEQATMLLHQGAINVRRHDQAKALLIATGAYQLREAVRASDRLLERKLAHNLVYVAEPGRFRIGRDSREEQGLASAAVQTQLFPNTIPTRVFLTHTRPEPYIGVVRRLDTGPDHTRVLGYISHGGTLDVDGMLFANRTTWAHAVAAMAQALKQPVEQYLSNHELQAVRGESDPSVLI